MARACRGGFAFEAGRSVAIPMRDNVRLFADIWRPKTESKVPVLVMRSPYNRVTGLVP